MKQKLSQALSEYAKNPNFKNAKNAESLQKKFEGKNYNHFGNIKSKNLINQLEEMVD